MPGAPENYCSYITKSIGVTFAVVAIILSWSASRTCQFISFRDTDSDPPDRAEDPPFNRAMAANVGIFRYQIVESVNGGSGECVEYEDRWGQLQGYPSVATAQFCSLLAPLMAVLGIFSALLDICVCTFPGSFMTASFFFLLASGLQAGTFVIVADPVFCFEDEEMECSQEKGVYLSIAATIIFFLAACVNCCSPHADPFCFNFGQRDKRPTVRKVNDPGQTTIVLQPVVIQTDTPTNNNSNRNNNSNNYKNNNSVEDSPTKKKKRTVRKK